MSIKRGTRKLRKETDEGESLSDLRKQDQVIAILTSDWHLCHRPPVARSIEENWYGCMRCAIRQIRNLYRKYKCPVIIAGDIFDKWENPSELINFAIKEITFPCFAIAGQHDLPNHDYEQIERSSYWTLVESGKVINIEVACMNGITTVESEDLTLALHGFPWGQEVNAIGKTTNKNEFHLAVIHQYVWTSIAKYPGAPESKNLESLLANLKGYNAAVIGDNHKGFHYSDRNIHVFNCGTLIRRKIDEKGYKPQVGLLKRDGSIARVYLDCEEDLFIKEDNFENLAEATMDIAEFVKELANLKIDKRFADFTQAVKEFCDKTGVGKAVRSILSEVMK